jgi:hypothetical protein
MTRGKRYVTAALGALALALAQGEASAAANGDGVCAAGEAAKFECATFGTSVVEYLGAFGSNKCPLDDGTLASCTTYYYRYTGGTTNQVNVAVPTRLLKTIDSATEAHCQQLFINGAGDPTTGFGKNVKSLEVCRTSSNLASAPDVTPPLGANFALVTDPSAVDPANPLDWQIKLPVRSDDDDHDDSRSASRVYAASLVGPFANQPFVQESAVTLVTPTGQTVSYSNIGGTLQITGGAGRIVPQSSTKLCVVKAGGDPNVPYTDPSFAANWDCGTVINATEQCDIKTDNHDPCRYIGGTCILY